MVFIATAQEWLSQSASLLEARPTTTRITTKYSIESARTRARKAAKSQDGSAGATAKPPRAKLILKTFDPKSGVCLKYKTSKAAEVGRLIQMLGSMGRKMAALPDLPAPTLVEEGDAGTATPPVAGAQQGVGAVGSAVAAAASGGAEAGKGKKKKKGKR